jgi:hypothetical protein
MALRAAVPDDAEIYKVCALCGSLVATRELADEICRDMDTDAKTCPHCCRTYGEARREEGIYYTQG